MNWTVAFLLLLIYCVLRVRLSGGSRMVLYAGVCLGLGGLGEPVLLATAVPAFALLVARRARLALVFAVAVGATLLPWTVRNFLVHGRLMAVKSTFWYVFWEGNNQHASGTDKFDVSPEVARALRWRASLHGLEAQMSQARREAVSMDTMIPADAIAQIKAQPREIDKMVWFKQESMAVLRQHPAHYLRMCAKRAFQIVWFDETNPRSLTLAYRAPYVLLLLFTVFGMVAALANPPHEWTVPASMAFALALVHVLVITSARFRLPLESLMLLPAASAIVWVGSRARLGGPFLRPVSARVESAPSSSDLEQMQNDGMRGL